MLDRNEVKEYVSVVHEYIAKCYENSPPLPEVKSCLDALEAITKAMF